MNEVLPPAVFLMGPTASGKTDLAEQLAARYPFEVISVDSALIYRDMNIGTAKPDAALQQRLPHQLIDIIDPDQSYSAADFRRDALPLMADIVARGNTPLLVGGSMLYFKVLREGLAELPAADAALRGEILAEAAELGWPALHRRLATIDPEAAAALHPNHSQRIQRALEVYYSSGETLTAYQRRQSLSPLPYRIAQIALWPSDRAQLHRRIEQRFEQMLHGGLIEEVATLRHRYTLTADMPSMRAVGYRQVWDHLEGDIDRQQLLERGVAATRQLAKRQLTWLRKWPDLQRVEVNYVKSLPDVAIFDDILRKIAPSLRQLGLCATP